MSKEKEEMVGSVLDKLRESTGHEFVKADTGVVSLYTWRLKSNVVIFARSVRGAPDFRDTLYKIQDLDAANVKRAWEYCIGPVTNLAVKPC